MRHCALLSYSAMEIAVLTCRKNYLMTFLCLALPTALSGWYAWQASKESMLAYYASNVQSNMQLLCL